MNFSLRECLKSKDIADLIFCAAGHRGRVLPTLHWGIQAKPSNHFSTADGAMSKALTSPHLGRMYPSRFDSCTSTVSSPLFPIAPVFFSSCFLQCSAISPNVGLMGTG